jgi:hypothetical protein
MAHTLVAMARGVPRPAGLHAHCGTWGGGSPRPRTQRSSRCPSPGPVAACSRSSTRRILPEIVLGSSANSMTRTRLYGASVSGRAGTVQGQFELVLDQDVLVDVPSLSGPFDGDDGRGSMRSWQQTVVAVGARPARCTDGCAGDAWMRRGRPGVLTEVWPPSTLDATRNTPAPPRARSSRNAATWTSPCATGAG